MKKILVVEDEPGIALALEDSLRLEGYDVQVISDGIAASRCAREAAFDLILLDAMLPGKDGFTICHELRSGGAKTPVIVLSARVRGLDLGASDYVLKSFSPKELMARVRRLLQDREDGREQQKQFEDELRAAATVQQSLFPRHHPAVEGMEYSAACRPAKGISGDYYDVIPLERGKLGPLLADVCGKGMPAALLGASLHGALRAFAPLAASRAGDLLERVNRLLFQTTSPERFATAFYGIFDPATRALTYANAGHYPPWLVRGTGSRRLETLTPPLGMLAEVDSAEVVLLHTRRKSIFGTQVGHRVGRRAGYPDRRPRARTRKRLLAYLQKQLARSLCQTSKRICIELRPPAGSALRPWMDGSKDAWPRRRRSRGYRPPGIGGRGSAR